MSEFVKVAKASEVPQGSAKSVEVSGHKVAVFNVGGTFYALASACAHRGGPLAEGDVDGTTVTCPWHGWSFDLKTGAATHQAASVPTFAVKVEGEDVLVSA